MPEPEPADKTTFKRWADWLWPLGGTVLGLLVMPLAIEQYPDFFDRNTWLLPFSLIVVILCWTIPFIVHKNSKRLYLLISSVPRVGSFLAPLLTVGCLALFAFGCFHLFRFHREHLVGALQKEQAGPVRVKSSRDNDRLTWQRLFRDRNLQARTRRVRTNRRPSQRTSPRQIRRPRKYHMRTQHYLQLGRTNSLRNIQPLRSPRRSKQHLLHSSIASLKIQASYKVQKYRDQK